MGLRAMMTLIATHAAVPEDGQEHTVTLVSSTVSKLTWFLMVFILSVHGIGFIPFTSSPQGGY